jgi:predicted lipoprotein with Yx(FWY)xxD motif
MNNLYTLIIIVLIFLLGGGILLAVFFYEDLPGISKNSVQNTIVLEQKDGIGSYLADGNRKTLYYFAKDSINISTCDQACQAVWPLYYAENINIPNSLNKADFGQIVNTEGKKQTTYKGWPLYYYEPDKNPGDTLGEGVNDVWFVLTDPFYTVMILNKESIGNYFTDSKGIALYYSTKDLRGTETTDPKSNCIGSCAQTWPIFSTEKIIVPPLIDAENFQKMQTGGQISYLGWPLYYYLPDDNNSENIKGNNINNSWYLAKP